jgi:hypothetical protein
MMSKNKYICLDCKCQFDKANEQQVADHTGNDGIFIEVCPVCISNHIQPTEGLYLPVLDAEDITGIERMANSHRHKCIDNKFHTTDATLLQHYSALIQQANDILKKIKEAKC